MCIKKNQQITHSYFVFVALKTGLSLFILLLVLSVLHVAVRPYADDASRFLRNTLPYLHNMTNTAAERGALVYL